MATTTKPKEKPLRKIREFKDANKYSIILYENEAGKHFVKTDKETMPIDEDVYNELIEKGDKYNNLRGLVGSYADEQELKRNNGKVKIK